VQVNVLARSAEQGLAAGELAELRSEERLDRAMLEPCVEDWLGSLGFDRRRNCTYAFRAWLRWLWRQPGYAGIMPSEVLDFQDSAQGRAKHELMKLIQRYAQEKGGTYDSIFDRASKVRSFFIRNQVALPPLKGWEPTPTREPVEGKLTFPQVVEIIRHADPRDTAIFLTMLQGMMDEARFVKFNGKDAERLVEHLKTKDLQEPFRIDFAQGRKRNRKRFFTFLHHDALQAWKTYFEKERGWPKPGDPLALNRWKEPISKTAIRDSFDVIARKLHYKPKGGHDPTSRTGVSPHDSFRDVVKSRLQTAKRKGFDMTISDFWMGHRIDPYNYNRFTENEPEYVLENAKIAAGYLNVITGPGDEQPNEELAKLREELALLKGQFKAFTAVKTVHYEIS
jgi:hypothetical protein